MIRIQYIHKISNPTPTIETLPGTAEDVATIEAALRFCKRNGISQGSKRHNRMEKGKVILFPRTGIWHSISLWFVSSIPVE